MLENVGGQLTQIEALGVPDELRAQFTRFADSARADLAQLRVDGIASLGPDSFQATNQMAVGMGLTVCGG